MKLDSIHYVQGESATIGLELDAGEGANDLLALADAITSGRTIGPVTSPQRRVLSLQPDGCRRGEQDCDDCPELRCGDQLWKKLREPPFAPILDPAADDRTRLDAALRLVADLRTALEDLQVETAERLAIIDVEQRKAAVEAKAMADENAALRSAVATRDRPSVSEAVQTVAIGAHPEIERLRSALGAAEDRLHLAGKSLSDATARASTWEARARSLGWKAAPGAEVEHG